MMLRPFACRLKKPAGPDDEQPLSPRQPKRVPIIRDRQIDSRHATKCCYMVAGQAGTWLARTCDDGGVRGFIWTDLQGGRARHADSSWVASYWCCRRRVQQIPRVTVNGDVNVSSRRASFEQLPGWASTAQFERQYAWAVNLHHGTTARQANSRIPVGSRKSDPQSNPDNRPPGIRAQRRRLALVAALAVGGLALADCGTSSSSTAVSTSTTRGSTASTSPAPTVPVANHILVATFADNGGTLTVSVHDRLRVVLAGTSWKQSSSNVGVLAPSGGASVLPTASGCVPDQGCGSVTNFFDAKAVGRAKVLGDRSNCDHAASTCTTGPNAFQLTVVVLK